MENEVTAIHSQNISRGNVLVCYIIDNYLTTIFLTRSINPDYLVQKAKERHPDKNVVFIEDPFTQLDAYIDIEKAKEIPEKPIEEPKPAEEPGPQLSDKERRLQAYRERMARLSKYNK
jgi:hypothetical protein